MLKRPSEHRLTLEERVAVVVALAIALGVHLAVFLGGSGISHLARVEQKRERLIVIRQVREITPAPELAARVPDPRRMRVAAEPAPADKAGGAPPKSEQKVSEHGCAPPPKAEITQKMEEELQESLRQEELAKSQEQNLAELKGSEAGDNSVSVVTDLPTASFTLSGPVDYSGTGTFWIRRGTPAGTYRIAFGAVDGFGTPPPQTKELQEKGQIVFVGKYRRSTEIAVQSNKPAAVFTIFRPDGRPLEMVRPGRQNFDNLPLGNYTVVFKDVPGRLTPAPMSRTLSAGGSLSIYVEYKEASGGPGGDESVTRGRYAGARGAGQGAAGGSGSGSGSGAGSGSGSGKHSGITTAGPKDGGLDRRVQMIVTSYPRPGSRTITARFPTRE